MGLGVNSFDSGMVSPVFQVPPSVGELTENLPNSSVVSLAPDVFVSAESSSPLEALNKSLQEVKKLEQLGQITDPALLKKIKEIELREQTYKELLSQGESPELTAFILDDVRFLKNTIETKTNTHQQLADLNAKKRDQQNIIYQRYTGGEMSEIADPNATWRKILAVSPEAIETRPEDIEKRLLENFQAENRKLIALSQSDEIQNKEKAQAKNQNNSKNVINQMGKS
jgi:hypothetical protein